MNHIAHSQQDRSIALRRQVAALEMELLHVDPRLPPDFEKRWSLKRLSQLTLVLECGHRDQRAILDLVIEREVSLGKVPEEVERQLDEARLNRWLSFDATQAAAPHAH